MKRLTNKQMQFIMSEMANDIIMLQHSFNNALDELERLDDKKRLHVLVHDKQTVVQSYVNKTDRI